MDQFMANGGKGLGASTGGPKVRGPNVPGGVLGGGENPLQRSPDVPVVPGQYNPYPQPFAHAGRGRAQFWNESNQYTPQPFGPLTGPGALPLKGQIKQLWQQVIPTSINVRNQELSNLMQSMNTPFT